MVKRFRIDAPAAALLVLIAASAGAQAAGAGNTSSGNTATQTSTNTSTNTSTQTSTMSGENRWAEEIYAGRLQGPEARAWLFTHPVPKAQRRGAAAGASARGN